MLCLREEGIWEQKSHKIAKLFLNVGLIKLHLITSTCILFWNSCPIPHSQPFSFSRYVSTNTDLVIKAWFFFMFLKHQWLRPSFGVKTHHLWCLPWANLHLHGCPSWSTVLKLTRELGWEICDVYQSDQVSASPAGPSMRQAATSIVNGTQETSYNFPSL